MLYDPSLTVREALALFYERNGFSREDDLKNFYRMNLGPFVAYVHNPKMRQELVQWHDIEHILYEIEPTIAGEAEISAITLANRGKKPLASYLYGAVGTVAGLFIDRSATAKALIRGLQRRSLFDLRLGDKVWNKRIGELRQELGIFV